MSTRTPKVTVVIPAYNRAPVIGHAIHSVLAQTFQDFEIIVVDDGSQDRTAAVVAAIGDPRIVIISHERNRGAGPARNTGARAGSAPYVAFLDSDDVWFPAKLEKLLSVFERSTDNLGLVYTGAERILPDGSVITDVPSDRSDLSRVLLTENVIGGTSVGMVRRRVFDMIGGFDENLRYTEERDLWLRISERFDIRCIPDVLVRIPQQNDRGRLSGNVLAVSNGREMFCRKHRQKLSEHGLLHLYLRDSGWWEQRHTRDLRQARRCYLGAIAERPLALRTYVLLLFACLPLSWHAVAGRCKHHMETWRRSTDGPPNGHGGNNAAPAPELDK